MKQVIFTVTSNAAIAKQTYKMVLGGQTQGIDNAGTFVNIKLNGFYLRRPISVCDVTENELTIIYKVVGGGTAAMAALPVGEKLDVLTGLGNGYNTAAAKQRCALVGGGVGVPPLYLLAKRLVAQGKQCFAVLGFNDAEQAFYVDEFKKVLGEQNVIVTTVDGSLGTKGFVTDALKDETFDYYYSCGPQPMLKAVHNFCGARGVAGELSFEERMGCGFGACMGCSCQLITGGYKRICKEGPVLLSGEVAL